MLSIGGHASLIEVNVTGRGCFPDSVLHIQDRTQHGELLRIGGAGQHHPQA